VNEENTNKRTDNSGLKSFLVVVGVFELWAAYRAKKRLDLLRHGELHTAKIVRNKRDSYDHDSGYTNIVTDCFYQYQVDGESYSHMILWTFGLKRKKGLIR
jgi:hypothetical protein